MTELRALLEHSTAMLARKTSKTLESTGNGADGLRRRPGYTAVGIVLDAGHSVEEDRLRGSGRPAVPSLPAKEMLLCRTGRLNPATRLRSSAPLSAERSSMTASSRLARGGHVAGPWWLL